MLKIRDVDFSGNRNLRSYKKRLKGLLGPMSFGGDPDTFGDLAQIAADSATYSDANGISTIMESLGSVHELAKLASLVTGPITAKVISSLYLSYQYGARLTIKDIQSIGQGVIRMASQIKQGKRITRAAAAESIQPVSPHLYEIKRVAHLKIKYANHDAELGHWLSTASSLGFSLSLTNVWDMIPWSFVIDWFAGIQTWTERVDTANKIRRMDILAVTRSEKRLAGVPLGYLLSLHLSGKKEPFLTTGALTCRLYNRTVSRECPVPRCRIDAPNSFDHWVEAAALFVQKK